MKNKIRCVCSNQRNDLLLKIDGYCAYIKCFTNPSVWYDYSVWKKEDDGNSMWIKPQ